jgi:hypothetical protein
MGMGEVVDSVKAGTDFSLGVVPASLGRAVYSLIAVVGKDTVEREEVPVEVKTEATLKILLLAASPDFENSFLMKWLGEGGHSVASRTMVSRGKAQETFVNRESSVLTPLTASMLGGFDVVIADAAALPARGTAEWGVLHRQVEEKGLGLILSVDSSGLDSMVRRRTSRVLVRDSAKRAVVGVMMEGAGKIVFSGDNTSYSKLLAGEKSAYAAYWSGLLKQVARRGDWLDGWSWEPGLARVGEEVGLRLQTGTAMPQGMLGSTTVYMAQDRGLGFFWRGKYWPEKAGWQMVCRPGGDTAWGYVWPKGAWKGVEEMRQMGPVAASRSGVESGRMGKERVELPKGWFAGLFLLGAVFLWVERKMGGMNG